ncbi:MAG: VWA domain-containing protein [Muribaculaceae bacterium]|nr:VWA domain-containing protein [Muribaculaceae bacterium]
MINFAHPQYFYLLLLLPALVLLFLWNRRDRRKRLQRYGRASSIEPLMPEVSRYKPWIRLVLELLLLTMVIVVLARPRAGASKGVTTKVHGIEVMVAIDVSNSMNASSTDNPQDVSRLQRSKMILEKLVDRLDNNKVGLIVFAGNAYMQMPMTSDAASAKLFLNGINTNMAPTQGTAIGAAINMALNGFSQSKKSQKAIIIITDGENFEDDAVEAAQNAAKMGVQVDVIGVGSTTGAPIPMDGGYLTDNNGEPVTTYLNEKMAQQIADAGKGVYISGTASDAVSTLQETLDKLAKSDLAAVTYTQHDEQFPVFATLALLLLLGLLLLLERKNPWLKKYNFFTKDQKENSVNNETIKDK